jgi:hypothetical protein
MIQRIITWNYYNMENYNIFLYELGTKMTCSIVWKFIFIICIILTKWFLGHFAELGGGVNITVQYNNVYSINGRR